MPPNSESPLWMPNRTSLRTLMTALFVAMLVLGACSSSGSSIGAVTAQGSGSDPAATAEPAATAAPVSTTAPVVTDGTETEAATPAEPTPLSVAAPVATFVADVWADNWFALYVDGELVGEDSVPITTERSFNKETISFEASLPFTVAIEAKDFKETDSGIEYIGEGNQQMGDGGLIVQITDAATSEVVATTSSGWKVLVVHRAPLNKECEKDVDPDVTCQVEILATPTYWTTAGFDDAAWLSATVWSEAAVSPKQGYDEVRWDPAAELVWGTDLETDNTILVRTVVGG